MKKRRYGEIPTLETRAEANQKVDRQLRYRQIIEILTDIPTGLTAKAIAVQMHKRGFTKTSERNVSAPRLTELCQKGIVEPIGKTKCRYTGVMVTVYILRREHDGQNSYT